MEKEGGGECQPCPEGLVGDGVTCQEILEEDKKLKVTCLELFCHDACEEDERDGFNKFMFFIFNS